MIQGLGCVLIAVGAAVVGFTAGEELKKQVRTLDELAAGLRLLEQELELSGPELERLAERLSRRGRGAAGRLFGAFARAIGPGDSVVEGWEDCVNGLEGLIPEGKVCLAPLGEILGRYDSREQRVCAAAVRERLEQLADQTRLQCRARCRTCQTVALSGGAFLMILLL